MMEANCEARMQLYKELVKERIPLTKGQDGVKESRSNERNGTLVICTTSRGLQIYFCLCIASKLDEG